MSILLFQTEMGAKAQDKTDLLSDRELLFDLLHSTVATIALCITITFILSLVRLWMNYQLRKKLLEHDAPAEIIDQILLNKAENLSSLKWCIVLLFTGFGLLAVYLLGPLDMRSLTVLTLSVAVGFGVYYLISQRLKK